MENIRRHRSLLTTLCSLKPAQRKILLRTATKSQINCLSEIAHNLVQGRIALTRNQKTRLGRFKTKLRRLGCKKASFKSRKNTAVQVGGSPAFLLPLLIQPALQLLGGLLGKN